MSNGQESLSPEVISLIQHVQLHDSGLWEKAIQRLVEGILWSREEPLSEEQILENLTEEFGCNITSTTLKELLEKLVDQILIEQKDGTYKLAEKAKKDFAQSLEEYQRTKEAAEDFFFELLEKSDVHFEQEFERIWAKFNEKLLRPMLHQMGATAYEFLFPSEELKLNDKRLPSGPVQDFLGDFNESQHDALISIILAFLSSRDEEVGNYIQLQFHSCLVLHASNLEQNTISSLLDSSRSKIQFTIFTDSNFILSVLELHKNPFNKAVKEFMNLIESLPNNVEIKMRVSPHTLEETKNTIEKHRKDLRALKFDNKKIANASEEAGLGGFAGRLLEVNQTQNGTITASDFLAPYTEHLQTILSEEHGIELYNCDPQEYIDGDKISKEVDEWYREDYYCHEYGSSKDRNLISHDVKLWHLVNSLRRSEGTESYVSNKSFMVATLDFEFMAYDKEIHEKDSSLCILPPSLIHLLDFWVPRSEEFQEAIMSGVASPLIARRMSPKVESLVVNILKKISRFELDDLSEDVITDTVMDTGLRNRIAETEKEEEEIETIKTELFQRQKEKQERIKEQLQKERAKISKKEEKVEQLEANFSKVKEEKEKSEKNAEEKLKELNTKVDQVKAKSKVFKNRYNKLILILKWVGAPYALLATTGLILGLYLPTLYGLPTVPLITGITLILGAFWLLIVQSKAEQAEYFEETLGFRLLRKYKKSFRTIITALSVYALWSLLKAIVIKIWGQELTKLIAQYLPFP